MVTNMKIGRFKGLGEMPAADLKKKQTMNIQNRSLLRVTITNSQNTEKTFYSTNGEGCIVSIQFHKRTRRVCSRSRSLNLKKRYSDKNNCTI